jgi:large subunit ribosomal protein L7/L12
MGIFGNGDRDSGGDEGLQRRVEELERRVAALEWAARSAGQAVPTAVVGQPEQPGDAGISPEVQQLVMQGKKIQAIKLLREQSGLGLREAKDIVDRL